MNDLIADEIICSRNTNFDRVDYDSDIMLRNRL